MSDSSAALRAEVNPNFKYKFLLIGVIALAVGLYHFIDPIFVYPKMRPASEAYELLKTQLKGDDGELQRQWATMAESNNWTEGSPKYSPAELTTNTLYSYFIGFLFTFVAGIPCLLTFFRCLGQWIGVEGDQLVNAKGQKVAFDQIETIDKSKWEKKGIAKLAYSENGVAKSFVIDDLKFDRVTSDQIMDLVEQRVGVDKITGGKSEAQYRTAREEIEREREERQKIEEAEAEADN
ncbi:hypothetical protein [Mariniblastus fucicola]|uniref:Uncharacterized protein n=1 Tax=Mariniblastus fucicola TaxID=980251 RepID=A0A5B9PJL5_9BACT|nr:hypothetical protein [Mariniblastus fucicola]QEG22851.1 hypothetical protein MFFC18_27370 [Mariniblastus fucicola]